MINILTTCPFCGKTTEVEVEHNAYFEWQFNGYNIQDVMPNMPASKREMLISGICEDCQKEIFTE